MNPCRLLVCVASASIAWLTVPTMAQWNSDPANNLSIADRGGDQAQPKIAPTPDGGAYISWYDNGTGSGYDVYMQRVNAAGVEQWPHNGVQIADRSVSSNVDYTLVTDQGGNAVIVFVDDRVSPNKITLQKVSPAGDLLFNGSQGVPVGNGSTVASPPTVAVLADGNYGVIWNSPTVSPTATVRQKVDSTTGALLWGATGMVQTDWLSPIRPVQASDAQPDSDGGMIVLYVRCSGSSCPTSSKQLFAQKYDTTGAPVWNAGVPVTVFAGTGSIQTGNFPRFMSDGSGGAVFGWYENGSSRSTYIQHVLSNGTLKFASPIAAQSTAANRIRVLTNFTYNPTTGQYFQAFDECDSGAQTNHVISVQRITPGEVGATLDWGSDGVALLGPDGFYQSFALSLQPVGDGCIVNTTWMDNTTRGYTYSARVGGSGTVAWNEKIATTYQTYSNRMTSALSTQGFCIVAVGAGASGSGDIQGIRVNFDGTLGNPAGPNCGSADFNCDGDLGTDSDIEAFFACLSGSCPAAPCTNSADFNGDGDLGTDSDIEAFFRVLSGGNC